jgi:hypothetical protein
MLWYAKRIDKNCLFRRGLCRRWVLLALLLLLAGSGCTMLARSPDSATSSDANAQWHDESEHVRGICFEAAWDAAGRIFIIQSAEEHIRFYDLADNSHLCRRPVGRVPRDFSNGYVIAGFWSRGTGCTASHHLLDFFRNDDTRTILMHIAFATEGTCPYELVRPFWIGLDHAANYEITLVVEEATG